MIFIVHFKYKAILNEVLNCVNVFKCWFYIKILNPHYKMFFTLCFATVVTLNPTVMECEVPEKCPVCNKGFKNLLLHIRTKESCNKAIDTDQYDLWKILSMKKNKRKYQSKYIESGKHVAAQGRYLTKIKAEIKKKKEERKEKFYSLARKCLLALKKGETLKEDQLREFQLVETDHQGSSSWTRKISGRLLYAVIHYQQVVLVSEEQWLLGMAESGMRYEEIFPPLIGKLNAYKNENTKWLCKEATTTPLDYTWHPCGSKDTFSDMDEAVLVHLIEYILGFKDEWNDGELAKCLKIDKILDDLQCALLNTKL